MPGMGWSFSFSICVAALGLGAAVEHPSLLAPQRSTTALPSVPDLPPSSLPDAGRPSGRDDAKAFIAVLAPAQQMGGQPSDGEPVIPNHHYLVRWISGGELGLLRVELHPSDPSSDGSYWLLSDGVIDDGAWDWFVTPGNFPDGPYYIRLVSTRLPQIDGISGQFVIKSSSLLYISSVLLMLTLVGTMCCLVSLCRAIQQARFELRRGERRGPRAPSGVAAAGQPMAGVVEEEEEAGEGEEGENEEAHDVPVARLWRPGTPPEEQLAQVSISRFQCCICEENGIDTVFVPCGHSVACGLCAHSCETCPICRAEIERIVKVFHK